MLKSIRIFARGVITDIIFNMVGVKRKFVLVKMAFRQKIPIVKSMDSLNVIDVIVGFIFKNTDALKISVNVKTSNYKFLWF